MIKLKRCWQLFLALTCIFLSLGLTGGQVKGQEVNFSIPQQWIEAKVNPDGSVTFEDYQKYQADFMNGARFTLDHQGYELTDFQVGVADSLKGSVEWLESSNSQNRKTYSQRVEDGFREVKVYYPLRDESKYFVYRYTLKGLVVNYQDTARLLRKFFGRGEETTDVTVRIELPGRVESKNNFRAWGYGAPQGEVELAEEAGVSVVYLRVPARTSDQFVEGDVVFPTALTPQNPNQVNENKLDQIIQAADQQVQQDAEALERDQARVKWIMALVPFFPPVLAIFTLVFYYRNRRKLNPEPAYVPDYLYEMPEAISPGEVATHHLRRSPSEDDFAATLLHLAQKRLIRLEEVRGDRKKDETVRIISQATESQLEALLPHEQYVYDYVTLNGTVSEISLKEIEHLIDQDRHLQKQQFGIWQKFRNYLAVEGERYRGKTLNYQGFLKFLLILSGVAPIIGMGLALALLGGFGFPLDQFLAYYLISLVVTVILVLFVAIKSARHPLRTHDQDLKYNQWQAFRRMLKDIGNFKMREIASLPLWEEYLVYATSLGVADKVAEALEMEFTAEELQTQTTIYGGGYLDSYWLSNMVSQQIGRSIQAATPASQGSKGGFSGTNTGGFGGGFSGGSMGGSGGGTSSGGF
ncbi:DUF2207 family protein [Facklamia languida]|uniref:DUF2207 domain-containing protein n=1 Tax=Facklamia languida CCUG 37842 TaxID=883113 RepID=H3NIS4_9LACT|nr:DUF2207 domain-containing protein [Facklamia languida]EHR37202.1 hypothetical protein HMPREF9708_00763 [Facklamia languida CCUG 37842]